MHEFSIVSALLNRIEAEARSREAVAVHHVRVRVGELSGIEGDLLQSAFELVRERTIAARADLEIVPVAARWICPMCSAEIPRGAVLRCPSCELPARLEHGDEILLDQIEMEVSDV